MADAPKQPHARIDPHPGAWRRNDPRWQLVRSPEVYSGPVFYRLPDDRTITLHYAVVPLDTLLADVAHFARSLGPAVIMRVYTDDDGALLALPALCASLGAACVCGPEQEERAGDRRPYGRFCFDIRAASSTAGV